MSLCCLLVNRPLEGDNAYAEACAAAKALATCGQRRCKGGGFLINTA